MMRGVSKPNERPEISPPIQNPSQVYALQLSIKRDRTQVVRSWLGTISNEAAQICVRYLETQTDEKV